MSSSNYKDSILALAPNAWEGQWVNRQQLLSRLARRQRRVLYSTGTWFSWDRMRPQWRRATWLGNFDSCDGITLDRPGRLYTRLPACPPLDRWNLRRSAHRWQRWLDEAGDVRTAYLFHPSFVPYLDYLQVERIVYHAYDLYSGTPGWTDALATAEQMLVERADLIVASSDLIAQGLPSTSKKTVRVLPNGADVAAFEQATKEPEPSDLLGIPRPWLGYTGSLHPQVDFGRIARLAVARPDWHFILIGSRAGVPTADVEVEIEACSMLPNVHFLGARRHDEIASYTAHMDVNLLCYRMRDDTWIKAGYPLKLHEYFAAGQPVVSADLATVRPFEPAVCIVPDDDQLWLNAIERALVKSDDEANAYRRQIARMNDWMHRVAQLECWLDELFAGSAVV